MSTSQLSAQRRLERRLSRRRLFLTLSSSLLLADVDAVINAKNGGINAGTNGDGFTSVMSQPADQSAASSSHHNVGTNQITSTGAGTTRLNPIRVENAPPPPRTPPPPAYLLEFLLRELEPRHADAHALLRKVRALLGQVRVQHGCALLGVSRRDDECRAAKDVQVQGQLTESSDHH